MLNFYSNKNKIFKISRFSLVFVLVFAWIFSGWPQIGNFPPEIQEARADNETLYVDGCGTERTEWGTMTNTPYLDDNDGSLIHEASKASYEMGDFSFANTATDKTGAINSVILYFECQADDGPSNDGFDVYINDGGGGGFTNEGNVAPTAKLSWGGWDTLDISTKLDTWTKIDAATMYLDTQNTGGGDDRYVRRAYLYIDYTTFSTSIEIKAQDYSTAVTTITFPVATPSTTVSIPYNDVDTDSSPQAFGGSKKPVVTLVNTAASAYNVWYNITAFSNSIVSTEHYVMLAKGGACADAAAIDQSATLDGANYVTTGTVTTIAATGDGGEADERDLYLKICLSTVAGKSGTSTLTILGETP